MTNRKYSRKEMLEIAMGAARSEIRGQGGDPVETDADEALKCLDEIARQEPELVASQWYLSVTQRELSRFARKWTRIIESTKRDEMLDDDARQDDSIKPKRIPDIDKLADTRLEKIELIAPKYVIANL